MTHAVAAELIKLRTVRTGWVLAAGAVALVVLFAVLTVALDEPRGEEDVRSLLSIAGVSGLFALIYGVVATAGEWRHNTITASLLVTPNRARLFLAKALSLAVAGALLGLLCLAVVAAIALPWLAAADAEVGLSGGELLGIVVGHAVQAALLAVLGVGLGALLTNQLAAVVVALAVLFAVDPTVIALVDGYAPWSLSGLGTAVSGGAEGDLSGDEVDLFPAVVSGIVLLGYAAVLIGLGTLRATRRDIA